MPEVTRRRGSCLGRLAKAALFGFALLLAVLAVWALVNNPPATDPIVRDRLSPREIATRSPERQAFAVRIGEKWAGSFPTKQVMDAETPRQLRATLGSLGRLVPYRLFIVSTDQYIGYILHEQFHALEAESNASRFAAAEASHGPGASYPWKREGYRAAWLEEVTLLQTALAEARAARRLDQVRGFLAKRQARRARFALDPAQLTFERELEWLEGLGKYAELEDWRIAAESGWKPLPEMRSDPQFHSSAGYAGQWGTERTSA